MDENLGKIGDRVVDQLLAEVVLDSAERDKFAVDSTIKIAEYRDRVSAHKETFAKRLVNQPSAREASIREGRRKQIDKAQSQVDGAKQQLAAHVVQQHSRTVLAQMPQRRGVKVRRVQQHAVAVRIDDGADCVVGVDSLDARARHQRAIAVPLNRTHRRFGEFGMEIRRVEPMHVDLDDAAFAVSQVTRGRIGDVVQLLDGPRVPAPRSPATRRRRREACTTGCSAIPPPPSPRLSALPCVTVPSIIVRDHPFPRWPVGIITPAALPPSSCRLGPSCRRRCWRWRARGCHA